MDNVTHALAGLLCADAAVLLVRRRVGRAFSATVEAPSLTRFRRAAVVLGIVAAELPDVDLVYAGPMVGMGKLGYLLHHRGHTHTIVWALIGALLLWATARWWWQRGLAGRERADATSARVAREGSRALLGLAVVGTLSHLLLDYTNSYGVHPFWPFDNRWYFGDAVFIVEPWLMVVAIPPLLWGPRRLFGRVLLLLALAGILALCWLAGEVATPVAVAVTTAAACWLLAQRALPAEWRPWSGLLAWVAVTTVFFVASAQARAAVRGTVSDGSLRDVVLTPAAADPRCFAALVVTATTTEYRVRTATVSPWRRLHGAVACAADRRGGERNALGALPRVSRVMPSGSARPAPEAVVWGETWSVSRAEFARLAATRCDFAAALRFMRTPAWAMVPDGALRLVDARFGTGGGFAEVEVAPSSAGCATTGKWIPPWVPPRQDLLR